MSGTSLTRKILDAHLASDQTVSGTAAFTIDSVLFHDMSGILGLMAYDDMKKSRAGVPMPVVFTDHNLTGSSPQTAMDQAFVRSCARAFGLRYSKAGNGICHALYAERIARPGLLMIGADSHSQSCGALGMLGIGMGGMEVAAAMTGRPFPLRIPKVIQVCLEGRLAPGVTAMDAGLTLLSRLSVKGALGACLEYTGSCESLSVQQRMTLCNLGAEMGATASLFPADRQVLAFLRSQNREADFKALSADPDVLIVDRMGKNISGTGMDTNITRSYTHGYGIPRDGRATRIAVLDLTEQTHDAAVGIGQADVTTDRLFKKIDFNTTYPNLLTSGGTDSAKIPMVLDNQKLCIQAAIKTVVGLDPSKARIIRIPDTLHITDIEISEAFIPEAEKTEGIEIVSEPYELSFDSEGNLF